MYLSLLQRVHCHIVRCNDHVSRQLLSCWFSGGSLVHKDFHWVLLVCCLTARHVLHLIEFIEDFLCTFSYLSGITVSCLVCSMLKLCCCRLVPSAILCTAARVDSTSVNCFLIQAIPGHSSYSVIYHRSFMSFLYPYRTIISPSLVSTNHRTNLFYP